MYETITTLVVWIGCAIWCYAIAKKKEKDPVLAIALGLLFGFAAVIGYALAKGSKRYQLRVLKEKERGLK